jgi:hypothetical protein
MAKVQNEETLLQMLETDSQDERIAVCLIRCPVTETTSIRLREESFSSHVGWYTQGHVDLSPAQVQALRAVLGPVAREALPAARRGRPVGAETPAGASGGEEPPATILFAANRAG